MNLNKNIKVTRVMNAQAVGVTTVNGSGVDMEGYEGVLFIAFAGAITDGVFDLKAQQDTVVGFGGAQDLAGTKVSLAITDDNKLAILEVYRPLERFVRPVVARSGVTGAVIDGVVSIQFGAAKGPTSHDATVAAAETHASPAEGTA